MTTYSHPHTFCLIVVQLIADRGWKIKKAQSAYERVISLALPDGTVGVSMVGGRRGLYYALLALCNKLVTDHKLPIKFDAEAFTEKYGTENERTPDDPFSHRHGRDPFSSMFDDDIFEEILKGAHHHFDWGKSSKGQSHGFKSSDHNFTSYHFPYAPGAGMGETSNDGHPGMR